jgi:hypothetical protein
MKERYRFDVVGFGPRCEKQVVVYVEPQEEYLAGSLTLRGYLGKTDVF